MFFKNAINKKNVCITLCRPPPFLGCSAAEIRRVYSNLPYINLESDRSKFVLFCCCGELDFGSDTSIFGHFE